MRGRGCHQVGFKRNADEHSSVELTLTPSWLRKDTDALCPWLPLTRNITISHLHAEQSTFLFPAGPMKLSCILWLYTGACKIPGGSDSNLCPSLDDKLESICYNTKIRIFFLSFFWAGHKWQILANCRSFLQKCHCKHLIALRYTVCGPRCRAQIAITG